MAWHTEHLTADERALVYDLDYPLDVRHEMAIRYTWELRAEVQRLREAIRDFERSLLALRAAEETALTALRRPHNAPSS